MGMIHVHREVRIRQFDGVSSALDSQSVPSLSAYLSAVFKDRIGERQIDCWNALNMNS